MVVLTAIWRFEGDVGGRERRWLFKNQSSGKVYLVSVKGSARFISKD